MKKIIGDTDIWYTVINDWKPIIHIIEMYSQVWKFKFN